jgi:hypothetical protein
MQMPTPFQTVIIMRRLNSEYICVRAKRTNHRSQVVIIESELAILTAP